MMNAPAPLFKSGFSLQADMRQGWRPKVVEVKGAPIPLYYNFDEPGIPVNPMTMKLYEPIYLGPRYKHSLAMHKAFAN